MYSKSSWKDVIRDAVTYTEHAKRKTVTAMDRCLRSERDRDVPSTGFGG